MPTGQVLRWHLRGGNRQFFILRRVQAQKGGTRFFIMTHPRLSKGAVAKPYSSAPSRVAIATSRPVRICPSVWRVTRPRRSLSTSVWCVSARPSSHGRPAYLMPVQRDAPVPPSWPETRMWSARALATPDATTPTPTSETSLTEMRARGFCREGGSKLRRSSQLRRPLARRVQEGVRERTHCALEVVHELLEVLDRVDVVVRRRRDEADARRRVTGAGDTLRDLVARQLTSLTGLGTLRHLEKRG